MKSGDIHPHGIYRLASGRYVATGADPYQANSCRSVYVHPVATVTRWPSDLWDGIARAYSQADAEADSQLRYVVPTIREPIEVVTQLVERYLCPTDQWTPIGKAEVSIEAEVARALVQRMRDTTGMLPEPAATASTRTYDDARTRFQLAAGFHIVADADHLNCLAARLEAADRLADAASRVTDASKPAMGDIVAAVAAYRKLRGDRA